MNWEQFGKTLDTVFKVLEEVTLPAKTATTDENGLLWLSAREVRSKRKCIRLNKDNADALRKYLLNSHRFDYVEKNGTTLVTDAGEIEFGDWIVWEEYGDISFYSDQQFKKNYVL